MKNKFEKIRIEENYGRKTDIWWCNMFYNIHDIVRIESFAEIYELKYFKTDKDLGDGGLGNLGNLGDLGNLGNLGNLDMKIGDDVSKPTYQDLLCSLSIEPDNTAYLGISKLIYWSRHVLYVNLVEPLLRLLLVPKGYALLHLACLEDNGKGIMISAPPDTGKTSCILKCLKYSNENGRRLSLLSDDMVIASQNGQILSFPKPFTISSHTLDSVFGMDTNLWYRIRSRVHSKGGRSTYQSMGSIGWLPIMSINALAQIVFEPPKLYPDQIMEIKIGDHATPKKLFFLSDEFAGEKEIAKEDAVKLIHSNTDNAYITPPYDKIFPGLTIKGLSYKDIIEKEAEITRNLIDNIEPMVIGRKDYSWYEYVLNGS